MKTILVTCYSLPPHFSGAGLRAHRLMGRLEGKHRFIALTVGKGPSEEGRTHRIRLVPEQGIWFPLHLLQCFIAVNIFLYRNRLRIDAIHMFSFPWLNRLLMLSNELFYHKPTILDTTLDGFDDPKSLTTVGLRNRMSSWLTRWLFARLDAVIAGSDACVESAIAEGIPKRSVIRLPRPVDERIFGSIPMNSRSDLRTKLGLPADKTIYLHVGRIQKRKNQRFMAEAVEALHQDDAMLVLIGPPGDPTYVEGLKRFGGASMPGRLMLLGERKDVNEFMIAADFLLFASENEGFPNVVVEALVSGLPVATVELDPIDPYINKSNGATIKNTDHFGPVTLAAFTQSLSEMRTRGFDRERIRKDAIENFGSARIDAQYSSLYSRLTKEDKRK
jgi:glycosyltransferase involved in cell wall biosynthesis